MIILKETGLFRSLFGFKVFLDKREVKIVIKMTISVFPYKDNHIIQMFVANLVLIGYNDKEKSL